MNTIKKIMYTALLTALGFGVFQGCSKNNPVSGTIEDKADTTQVADTSGVDTSAVDTTATDTSATQDLGMLTFTASNPSGKAPHTVTFTAFTDDTLNKQYDFDFDGDGVADLTTTNNGPVTASNTYTEQGVNAATVTATDIASGKHARSVEWISTSGYKADFTNFEALFLPDGQPNFITAVGADAPATASMAAIDVLTGLQSYISQDTTASDTGVGVIDVESAVLDNEVASLYNQNTIIIGNACENTLAAEFENNPAQCIEGLVDGMGVIKMKQFGDHYAVLVAGYSAQDLRNAAQVLGSFKNYALSGNEVEISGVSLEPAQSVVQVPEQVTEE